MDTPSPHDSEIWSHLAKEGPACFYRTTPADLKRTLVPDGLSQNKTKRANVFASNHAAVLKVHVRSSTAHTNTRFTKECAHGTHDFAPARQECEQGSRSRPTIIAQDIRNVVHPQFIRTIQQKAWQVIMQSARSGSEPNARSIPSVDNGVTFTRVVCAHIRIHLLGNL